MEISCLDQRAQSGQSAGPAWETLARNLVICTPGRGRRPDSQLRDQRSPPSAAIRALMVRRMVMV